MINVRIKFAIRDGAPNLATFDLPGEMASLEELRGEIARANGCEPGQVSILSWSAGRPVEDTNPI